MRRCVFRTALLVLGALVIDAAHAAPVKAHASKASIKKKPGKDASLSSPVVKTDSLAHSDSLRAKSASGDSAFQHQYDSLVAKEKTCQSDSKSKDSLLNVQRNLDFILNRRLDSTRNVAALQHSQLEIQKDSLRILDSLRKAGAPDTNIVLFAPIAYDTLHHADDSTLSRALTKSLQASLLQYGKFQLWVPTASDRGCRAKECWATIARRKGAGQVLTGELTYSKDTLIYTTWMTSLTTGAMTRQSQVVGFHRESDPGSRFSRIAAGQLFGIAQEPDVNEAKVESPMWRRLLLLGIFGVFAGTVVALSW